jgi:phosphoglycolate phosphatase-like HAD superfamily hydrolase
MTPIRALILDFDGVVLESNNLKTAAFEKVFARFPEHAAAMMAYHHAHVSESRFEKFRHLAKRLGKAEDDPVVRELERSFSADMLRLMKACPMVPGALEFLTRVRGSVPVYLASVTPQEELETILRRRGLAACFTRVYGCPPWTKTKAIAEIVAETGGAEGVLFIGDSAGDQRAAAALGVPFLARRSGLAFDDPQPTSYEDLREIGEAIAGRLPPSKSSKGTP